MKPRNREINIFNMSLLDILCGALGTFCFLMLVLFPYYSVGKGVASKAPDIPQGVDPKTFEEAKARIEELEKTLKKFQDYAKDLENQATQLKTQVEQLKQQAKQQGKAFDQLELRNPVMTIVSFVSADPSDKVELYVEDPRTNAKGDKTPPIDVTKSQQAMWSGDLVGWAGNARYWVIRDTPQGTYRFLLKVISHNPAQPATVFGIVDTERNITNIPEFRVAETQVAVPLANVTVTYGEKGYSQKVDIIVPRERLLSPAGAGQNTGQNNDRK